MKKIGLGILAVVVIASLGVGVAFAVPPSKVIEKAQGVGAGSGDAQVVAPPQDLPFPQSPESELTKILFIRYALHIFCFAFFKYNTKIWCQRGMMCMLNAKP